MTMQIVNSTELIERLHSRKLFIFDFDGTIADTETYQWMAYNECLKDYNVTLNIDDINRYIGHTEYKIYETIKKDFNIDFDNQEFFEQRIEIYLNLTNRDNLQPFTFFNELIEAFPEAEFVVLSSQKEEIIKLFFKKWNVEKRFSRIISVLDHKISKEEALGNVEKYYGYTSEESALFEDTNRNLALGLENNIMSIGVEHQFNVGLLKDCHVIIRGKD